MPNNSKVLIQVRLPLDLRQRLRDYVAEHFGEDSRVATGMVIRQAIKTFLDLSDTMQTQMFKGAGRAAERAGSDAAEKVD